MAKYESKKEAYKSEEKLILELKSYNPDTGYNVNIGNKIPKELMGKRIDQLKAIIKTPEQIEMIRNLGLKRKGKKATKETKERLSKSHMGQMAWNKGKKLTPEHIEKLRNAKLGKKLSNEHKENIKKSHLSRVIS